MDYEVSVQETDLEKLLRHLMVLPPSQDQEDLCLQGATWWDPDTGTVNIQKLLIAFGYPCRARNLDEETMECIREYINVL